MMDKQHIINEIHRTAKNGKAIGQKLFFTETGIKVDDWSGKYWAKWGDALVEAGYPENDWTIAYDDAHILQSILQLTRKLGKVPTKAEMQLERRSNTAFPSINPIRRLGSKLQLMGSLLEYCRSQEGYEDVEQILKSTQVSAKPTALSEQAENKTKHGYVYLLMSGKNYKIGHTISALSRTTAISNMTPDGALIDHLIRTDDPRGIEAYWHNRFAEKRGNGEWFALSAADVAAFKRRKFM